MPLRAIFVGSGAERGPAGELRSRHRERELAERTWALGDAFSMPDCAASPALFYAHRVEPFSDAYPRLAAYFARLLERPSVARATAEAAPSMQFFPG